MNAKADAAVSQGDVDNAYLWITRVELGHRRRLLPHVPGLDITQLIVRGLEARHARARRSAVTAQEVEIRDHPANVSIDWERWSPVSPGGSGDCSCVSAFV